MSIWATCSSVTAAAGLVGGLLGTLLPGRLVAQISQQEALAAAFPPPAAVHRHTAFLTTAALDSVRSEAGADAPVGQSVVSYYLAEQDGHPLGVAYFDSHRVRTLNEVVMIVVQPDDRIRSIEVLRFAEPPQYHASDPWLSQFEGRELGPELSLKAGIATMTGATLTSHAITRAARRVLALHRHIRPFALAAAP